MRNLLEHTSADDVTGVQIVFCRAGRRTMINKGAVSMSTANDIGSELGQLFLRGCDPDIPVTFTNAEKVNVDRTTVGGFLSSIATQDR